MNKKELLMNAALRLFVEQGFHGTATAKISKEAGVGTGTLFQHFKTKEELVIALFVDIKNEITGFIHSESENETNTADIIKTQINATLAWALKNTMKFDYVQLVHTSPYIKQIDTAELQKHLQVHFDLIEKGKAEKIIKDMPTSLLYSLISSQTFGLYQYILGNKIKKEEQEKLIENTINILWEMISQK